MKDKNPIEHIRFYYKYDENRAIAFKKGEVRNSKYTKSLQSEILEVIIDLGCDKCNLDFR